MRIAVDFDGTVVAHGPYDLSPPVLRPGARRALWRLRAAGHELLLFSARANRGLRFGPQWDPVTRAGYRRLPDAWAPRAECAMAEARFRQMVDFVDLELPGVFHAVDDGMQGKPVVDLFIDDKAYSPSGQGSPVWEQVGRDLGTDWAAAGGSMLPSLVVEEAPYQRVVDAASWANRKLGMALWPIGWTSVGPVLAVTKRGGERGRVAVIAGQHGEEQAGVAAVSNRWSELAQLAVNWGVELRVYPCANPEGFDHLVRFNARRQEPTNAAIEYEVLPGVWRGEVDPGERWLATRRCAPASDESRWLVNDLQVFRPDVVLDLHGDSDVPAGGAFAYVFGERAPYAEGMRRSGAVPYADAFLRNRSWTDAAPKLKTDDRGLCSFNDGSVTAWAWLCGARLATCVEVDLVEGGFERAESVAWEWVRWAVEAGGRGTRAGNLHPMLEDAGGVVDMLPFDKARRPQ